MSSRALVVVLVLAALLAAWLFVGQDLLMGKGGSGSGGGRGDEQPGALSGREGGPEAAPEEP